MYQQYRHANIINYTIVKVLLLVSVFTLLSIALPVAAAVTPDDPSNFITTWNTENPGTSNDNQITIPGNSGGYSYEIYWEDIASSTINGTSTLITTVLYTLTFPAPGIYEVQISGDFPEFRFGFGCTDADQLKLLSVDQWGDQVWREFAAAFFCARNMQLDAADTPDLSGVTTMQAMFQNADSFSTDISNWDVSNVENFSQMFKEADEFNQPLNDWSTISATDMFQMFFEATSFNQPIQDWDVSNVTSMTAMFRNSPFNQTLNQWDVSAAVSLAAMFRDTSFNQPLDLWQTASTTAMNLMFSNNTSFDQDLSAWDVSNVTNATSIFENVSLSQVNLDATLESWSQQSVLSDISFHLGLKTYSEVGAAALQTLRDTYNWTITEQYSAEYYPGPNASMIGDNIQSP